MKQHIKDKIAKVGIFLTGCILALWAVGSTFYLGLFVWICIKYFS